MFARASLKHPRAGQRFAENLPPRPYPPSLSSLCRSLRVGCTSTEHAVHGSSGFYRREQEVCMDVVAQTRGGGTVYGVEREGS